MKITVVGAGNVGATTAMRLLEAGLGDIVLVDILEPIAKGKAEDLMDAASIINHNCSITGTSDYSLTKDSDIVVITAGFARQPGMTREELLNKNVSIVKEVASNVKSHSGNPIVIVVTNPLDVMTQLVLRETGFDKRRVLGMAGILDSSRMNLMVSRSQEKDLAGVDSMVMGTHGQTMVPISSHSKVEKEKLEDLFTDSDIEDIIENTKLRGAEIISYLGKGSAYYAPSAGVFKMVKAIAEDSKEIIPCSCLLSGEYGIDGICLGVPIKIGREGLVEILQLELTDNEKDLLNQAAEAVRSNISLLGL